MVYGVEAMDPGLWLAATVGLTAMGFVACLVPSWRAAAVDPVAAMRIE
jgi:ABC-type lipoprotein release transport system permease subunit